MDVGALGDAPKKKSPVKNARRSNQLIDSLHESHRRSRACWGGREAGWRDRC